jgi:hypothetical protein
MFVSSVRYDLTARPEPTLLPHVLYHNCYELAIYRFRLYLLNEVSHTTSLL